jgi:acetolactate synthase-1/2/3 large subunit
LNAAAKVTSSGANTVHTSNGGEAIVQALRNLGVDYVMSSPGSEWSSVWEAFARQAVTKASGPTFLSCWHETLALDLAIGYTAMTRRMQAVLLHAGVGLLQGAMAINAARITGTPMLIMSGESLSFGEDPGCQIGAQWYTAHNTAGGLQRLMEPLVKWSSQATSAATLHAMVMRAGELALSHPAGPTYLDVPIEHMLHEWSPPAKLRTVPRAPKPRPPVSDVEKVAGLLIKARHPLIATESCGREPEGYKALIELAELLSIPVLESSVAEFANFPKDHPLHQGFDIQPLQKQADVVLLVRNRVPWYPPNNGPANATVVAIDEDAFKTHMAYQNLQADMLLQGDVPSTLAMLSEAVRASQPDPAEVNERRKRWSGAHDELHARQRKAHERSGRNGAIDVFDLCEALGQTLPHNAIYTDETTTHRQQNLRHLELHGPQSYFRVPSGLGQGLGVSLGIKLAARERPVVSLIGDGGFLYNPVTQSLGLAQAANLPLLIVVYNNDGYKGMKKDQLTYYPQGFGARHSLFYGATLGGPRYEELVAPFGGVGIRVNDRGELGSALKKGLMAVEEGRTALVDVVLEA